MALSPSLRGLDRRGEGLFALMRRTDDPDMVAVQITSCGLHVQPLMPGIEGRDIRGYS